jgi:hypothetical protein
MALHVCQLELYYNGFQHTVEFQAMRVDRLAKEWSKMHQELITKCNKSVWQTLPSSPVDKENRCLTTSFNQ